LGTHILWRLYAPAHGPPKLVVELSAGTGPQSTSAWRCLNMYSPVPSTHYQELLSRTLSRSHLPAPTGLVGLAGMVVHWSYSLFFIMGELWGGVAISLLFW